MRQIIFWLTFRNLFSYYLATLWILTRHIIAAFTIILQVFRFMSWTFTDTLAVTFMILLEIYDERTIVLIQNERLIFDCWLIGWFYCFFFGGFQARIGLWFIGMYCFSWSVLIIIIDIIQGTFKTKLFLHFSQGFHELISLLLDTFRFSFYWTSAVDYLHIFHFDKKVLDWFVKVQGSGGRFGKLRFLFLAKKRPDTEIGSGLGFRIMFDNWKIHGVILIVLRIHIINISIGKQKKSVIKLYLSSRRSISTQLSINIFHDSLYIYKYIADGLYLLPSIELVFQYSFALTTTL